MSSALRRWLVRLSLLAFAAVFTACAEPEPRSAVVIVVDTLRADHLGFYGYERDTTPELDRWAERGRVFERAQATSPWTLPSIASVLTGQLPSRHGARRIWPTREALASGERPETTSLDPAVPMLPETLAEAGLSTGAIVNNPFLRSRFGLDRGFKSYDWQRTTNKSYRRADEVVDLALAFIDRQDERPFFLFLHVFDPHMTYDPPASTAGRFTEGLEARLSLPVEHPIQLRKRVHELSTEDRVFIEAAYDEEIAHVDLELGRLLAGLESRELLDEVLVVLTSDHGEELFDHGGFEHGHSHYQELLHVPLVLWGPGVEPGRSPEGVSIHDIPATVAHALGIDTQGFEPGLSLWPVARGEETSTPTSFRRSSNPVRSLVAEGSFYGRERSSLVEWPLKLVIEEDEPDAPRVTLFDLAEDPMEADDLAEAKSEIVELLSRRLIETQERNRSSSQPTVPELDGETREELEALGYIE